MVRKLSFKKISPLTLDRLRIIEEKLLSKRFSSHPYITDFHIKSFNLEPSLYLKDIFNILKMYRKIFYKLPESQYHSFYKKTNKSLFVGLKELILKSGGIFVSGNNTVNLVGFIGMDTKFQSDLNLSLRKRYLHEPREQDIYNDLFLILYTDVVGKTHVFSSKFSASPKNLIIADATMKGGTAHLMEGQFIYKIGIHNTTDREHIEYVKENRERLKLPYVKVTENKASYQALVQRFPVVVWRSTSNHNIKEDFETSVLNFFNMKTINNYSGFFGINIHLSHPSKLFSVGCQVIPDIDFYVKLINITVNCKNKEYIPYFLFYGI